MKWTKSGQQAKTMTRKEEIMLVKTIGENIGYGNMMNISCALWRKMLKDMVGSSAGAFIPVLHEDIKKSALETTDLIVENHDTEIETVLQK